MASKQPKQFPVATRVAPLSESWLEGVGEDSRFHYSTHRTQAELRSLGITEPEARKLRAELQALFDQWCTEHGHVGPPVRHSLLMLSLGEEAFPFDNYAAFLQELHATKYPPLEALSMLHGIALEAVLFLSEVAAGHFDSARDLREGMDCVLLELERDRTKALSGLIKDQLLPAAQIGWRVQGGPKQGHRAKDKKRFQALAKARRHEIATTADLKKLPEMDFFVRQYTRDTHAAWLKEIGITLVHGRPRKPPVKS